MGSLIPYSALLLIVIHPAGFRVIQRTSLQMRSCANKVVPLQIEEFVVQLIIGLEIPSGFIHALIPVRNDPARAV